MPLMPNYGVMFQRTIQSSFQKRFCQYDSAKAYSQADLGTGGKLSQGFSARSISTSVAPNHRAA
jgi:hypothetical protein